MPTRPVAAAAWAAALIGYPVHPQTSLAQSGAARLAGPGLGLAALQIRSGPRVHPFIVEVARTEAEQARGLMFRRSLAPNAGMIFPFRPARPASFWMKNTLIPLDIIFIRSDGSIARIAANAAPHWLQPVGVAEPVAAVLEIAGGRAAKLGIGVGDRVSWADRR